MIHNYDLKLNVTETNESISVSGSFSEEEWILLNDFLDYAEDMLKTNFVSNNMPISLNISFDTENGMSVSSKLPDWDDVTVFLHKFRPIGLQSESTNFYKICNILAKELAHSYFRNMLEEQREIYNGKRMQSMFRIQSDEVVLNSDKVLYDWLNSYEYHRDKEKKKFIENLHVMFPLDASKVLFLSLLFEKVRAIYNLAIFIRVVVGKQKGFEGQIRITK